MKSILEYAQDVFLRLNNLMRGLTPLFIPVVLMKKYILFIAAVAGLDQFTKYLVIHNMELYESFSVIEGFFNITFILNPGAAFGMMADLNEAYRQLFFIIITIIAIIIIVSLAYREKQHKLRLFSYMLIISGALGNLIDRIFIGKVVDFLDFYIGKYHWPAFNVADCAISVGIFFLIVDIIFFKEVKSADKA